MERRTNQPDDCRRVRALVDDYVSGELEAETRHDVDAHAIACGACSRILESAERLRRTTRAALAAGEPPLDLEAQIRARLRAEPVASPRTPVWAMAAAAALVAMVGVAWMLHAAGAGGTPLAARSNTGPSDAFLVVGLRHHAHCTEVVPPPATPVEPARMEEKLGPEYAGLVALVREHVPTAFTIVDAHRCRSEGRAFVHLLLRGDGGLVSILVTDRGGVPVADDGVREILGASGLDVDTLRDGTGDVTAFTTERFVVYVVAEGPTANSAEVATAVGPGMRGFLDTRRRA